MKNFTCIDCKRYFKCRHTQGPDDWCTDFGTGNGLWYVTVALMGIGLIVFLWFISGCTDRMHYRHEWLDPNGTPQSIVVDYSEGVGNSDKQAISIVLPDRATLTVGRSMTDQDEFMKVLKQYGITLEKLADAWLKEQIF